MTGRSSQYHRLDIDGLRAVAVLPVLLFHAKLVCPGGFVGVDIFFVISGFVISTLILREMHEGTFNLMAFWERRIRRILPALVVVVLATLVAGWVYFVPTIFTALGQSAAAQTILLSNLYFYREWVGGSGYFTPGFCPKPLQHTWSLAVEEQFYLFFPLLLAFLVQHRKFSFKEIFLSIAAGFLAVIAYGYYYYYPKATFFVPGPAWELLLETLVLWFLPWLLWFLWRREKISPVESLTCIALGSFLVFIHGSYQYPAAAFYLLPSRAWELLLGALLALTRGRFGSGGMSREVAGWLGLGLIGCPIFFYHLQGDFPRGAAIPACLGAVFVIFSSESKLSSVGRMLALKPVVFFGLISYSLYLWHWPLLVISQYCFADEEQLARVLALVVAVLLATVSWKYVETPFRKGWIVRERGQTFWLAGGSLAMLLACGLIISCTKGFPFRYSRELSGLLDTGQTSRYFDSVSLKRALAGEFVKIGSRETNRPVDLVLFGDSHAMSIAPVLDKLCQQHGWRGIETGIFDTQTVLEFSKLSDRPRNTNNWTFGDVMVDYIRENHVKTVVIAIWWNKWAATDQFRSNVLSTVRAILDTQARVFVLEDYPQQNSDFQAQIDYRILNGRDFDKIGVLPEQHREKKRGYAKMFEQLPGMGATVLDPAKYFLNDRGLYGAVKNNEVLYFDDNHLTAQGAMLLAPLFEPVFTKNER